MNTDSVSEVRRSISDSSKIVLYFVTEDWYFWSHRRSLAQAAARAGYSVVVACRVNQHQEQITAAGFKLIPLRLVRSSKNPFKELATFIQVLRLYRCLRPDIAHQVGIKPILYGSFARLFCRNVAVVNALAGMGYLYSSTGVIIMMAREILSYVFGYLFNQPNTITILQNGDDYDVVSHRIGVDQSRLALIRGSGVDPMVYHPGERPSDKYLIVFAGRMLWMKGVRDFVNVARAIKKMKFDARFVLIGSPDRDNPTAVPDAQLDEWAKEGCVECWGHRDDMPDILRKATIVCLPSVYGEGVPKILIEAAASGCPIVAYDSPGCREIVRDGINGRLVPMRNESALVEAIIDLLNDPVKRKSMSESGREIALNEFSSRKVNDETLSVYRYLTES